MARLYHSALEINPIDLRSWKDSESSYFLQSTYRTSHYSIIKINESRSVKKSLIVIAIVGRDLETLIPVDFLGW